MGLSSKQVSRDVGASGGTELGWNQSFLESGALEFSKKNHTQVIQLQQQQQQQQQLLLQRSQMAPLKCPRCDSMNTKFCYYNNYNRSQPRHFCKACKRHWTKGGMLRNVPVVGGRKNKRLKTTNTNNNKSTSKRVNVTNRQHQQKQQQQHIINDSHDHLGHVTVLEPMRETWREGIQMNQHQKNMSEVLNQAFISPTTLDFVNNQNSYLVASEDDGLSSSPVPNFNFTGLTSTLENHPSSMLSSSSFDGGFQSSNVFNFIGEETSDEDLTNPATITTASILLPPPTTPWQAPNTNSILDSTTMTPPVNWSWEDLNTLISTDLNQPWDDDGNQDK